MNSTVLNTIVTSAELKQAYVVIYFACKIYILQSSKSMQVY